MITQKSNERNIQIELHNQANKISVIIYKQGPQGP